MGVYEFGSFSLNTTERVLLRSGRVVDLPQKPFDILVTLIENSGHLVTKEELFEKIWPDAVVEDGNLTVSLSRIRKALGERRTRPKFIVTVPCRGYRFIGKVRQSDEADCYKRIDSLAILPFTSTVNDPDTDFLSEGIAESIINNLSRLAQLKVIARSTVFRYSASTSDPQEIGRLLGVHAVLTGRVQRTGERLSVTAELVNIRNGLRIWGDRYCFNRTDLLVVETELAAKVSEEVRHKLSGEQTEPLSKRSTEHLEAYESFLKGRYYRGTRTDEGVKKESDYFQVAVSSKLRQTYLKGRFHWSKRSEEGLRKAIGYFEEAITLDSNDGLARAGLADCYNILGFHSMLPPAVAFRKAQDQAVKALAIDANLAEAHASLGFAKFHWECDWQAAEESLNASIKLKPNYGTCHLFYGAQLVALGRFKEAIDEYRRALEIEPLSLIANAALGYGYYFARRYDEAIQQCKVATEMDDHFEVAHTWLGWAYLENGMGKEALTEFERAVNLSCGRTDTIASLANCFARCGKKDMALQALKDLTKLKKRKYVSPYRIAAVHSALGNIDHAFVWLGKAREERSHLLINLKVDPSMDYLHADPRFIDLAALQKREHHDKETTIGSTHQRSILHFEEDYSGTLRD